MTTAVPTATNTLDVEHELQVAGMRQMIGLDKLKVPSIPSIVCEHTSDGHTYDETPTHLTLCCSKCGLHYNAAKTFVR